MCVSVPIPKIIAFTGLSGSGKDLAASFFEDLPGNWRVLKFAALLKSVVAAFLSVSPEFLEKCKELDNLWGETNRKTLIRVSGVFKELYGDDVWIKSITNVLDEEKGRSFLVTDLRYPSEAEVLRSRGAYLVRINRFGGERGLPLEAKHTEHSETVGLSIKADYVIENYGTIEEFKHEIHKMLVDLGADIPTYTELKPVVFPDYNTLVPTPFYYANPHTSPLNMIPPSCLQWGASANTEWIAPTRLSWNDWPPYKLTPIEKKEDDESYF